MSPLVLTVAGIPGASAIALWAIRWPDRFALSAVLGMMVLPVALVRPGGTQVSAADLLLLCAVGGWLLAGAAGAGSAPFISGNRLFAPTVAWVVVNAMSFAWTVDARSTAKSVVQMTEIVIAYPLVFATLPRSVSAVRAGLVVIVGASCVLAGFAAVSAAPDLAHGHFSATDLSYGLNKNAAGSYIAAGFVIAYVLLLSPAETSRARRWLTVALTLEAIGFAATLSRGSMIGAFAAICLSSFILRRGRATAIVVAIIALCAYLFVVSPQLSRARTLQDGGYTSAQVRHYSFHDAWEKIGRRPILGVGSGAYTDYIPQINISLPDPNNFFLLTWAEIGIAGLAALGFLLYRYLAAWLSMRSASADEAPVGVAAGAVCLAFLIHFQFDVTWTRGTTSMAFAAIGLLVAVTRLAAPPVAGSAS